MLYIRLENHFPVEATDTPPKNIHGDSWAFGPNGEARPNGWMNRNDIKSWNFAFTLAKMLTLYAKDGRTFLPCQNKRGTDFDIVVSPKVGDKVSQSFNGDSYPEGEIVKITPSWQVTTSTGAKFRRYQQTAGWKQERSCFWMVSGVHDERNPSF